MKSFKTDNLPRFGSLCACLLALLSISLFFIALTTQQSLIANVFGRYSWLYAAFLLLVGISIIGLAIYSIYYRSNLLKIISTVLTRLPFDYLFAGLVAIVGTVVLLYSYPAFGILTTFWFIGSVLTFLAALLILLIVRFQVMGIETPAVIAVWSFVFAAVLWAVLAYLSAGPELLGLVGIGGPVAGYMIFRCYFVLESLRPQWLAKIKSILSAPSILLVLVSLVGLALFIIVIYRDAFQHALLLPDELHAIDHVHNASLIEAVLTPKYTAFFRPLFQLQAYFDYKVFRLHYPGYVLTQLGLVWLSASVLFMVILKTSKNILFACLLAAAVVAHRFVSDLVTVWSIDTLTLAATFVVLALYTSSYWMANKTYYIGLGLLLLLACISRENGLLAMAGVGLGTLVRFRSPGITRLRAIRELLVISIVILVYGVMRYIWLGISLPSQLFLQGTCFGTQLYQPWELIELSTPGQIAVIGYTAFANVISIFIPFAVNDNGCFQWSNFRDGLLFAAMLFGYLLISFAAWRRLNSREQISTRSPVLSVVLSLVILAGGPILVFASSYSSISGPLLQLDLWLHASITSLTLYIVLSTRKSETPNPAALVNILGAILGMILLSSFYFRYRNFYLYTFYWASFVVIGWQALAYSPYRRFLKATLVVLLAAALLVNTVRIGNSLPLPLLLPENFNTQSGLCDPWISDDLARQVGDQYGLQEKVSACRAEARCNLDAWKPLSYMRVNTITLTPGECL
jgi:hypothetical protein